jgi:hypothetical protein
LTEETQVKNCLINIFGEKRYLELKTNQPTQQEVGMIEPCMPLLKTVVTAPSALPGNSSEPKNISAAPPGMMPLQDFQKYIDMIKKDPSVCNNATGTLAEVCKSGPAPPVNATHGSAPTVPGNNKQPLGAPTADPNTRIDANGDIIEDKDLGPLIDPDNPPRIVTYNFIDLSPFVAISKIRSITGHMYAAGDSEYDETGKSCRSMKHYFESYTTDQRWNNSFGSYNTKGNVSFYSPVDGTLDSVVTAAYEGGTEYQFRVESSLQPRIGFSFHHVDLLPVLRNGGEVTAGQLLGTIYRNNGQGEIATDIQTGKKVGDSKDYISFFDVMSDELFAQYQAKGINSRSQMTIPLAEREANPIGCTLGDGQGGKFIPNSDLETFNNWQDGTDNWVFMKN